MKDKIDAGGMERGRAHHVIASAKDRLQEKLIHLDPKSLGISEYNQRYLGTKIQYVEATLDLYGRLLSHALEDSEVSLDDFVIVDYGGGSGLIALLALEIGFGRVIYNDIFEVSCKDVQKLANALELKLEQVVPGDVEDLVRFLRNTSIEIDAIVSNDVLEHIYALDTHFRKLTALADHPFRVVYATGANIQNWRYARDVRKQQIEVEYQDREAQWGHKERDTLQAYLKARRDLISGYAPYLEPAQVDTLAIGTRGLMKPDIEKCVDEYREKGAISYRPDHPTNTCDPYTGNWCEHLMDFDWLERTIGSAGFSVAIVPGQYFVSGSSLKRTAKILINTLIGRLGRRCMPLAPYYVVLAESPGGPDR